MSIQNHATEARGGSSLRRSKGIVPGLRSYPWWAPTELPFVQKIENDFLPIRREFMDIALGGLLRLHPQSRGGPQAEASDGDWNIYELWSYGALNEANALFAPRTVGLLKTIPEITENPIGVVYFSVLAPHVTVKAHCGVTNAKIRIHLGLDIPPGAVMRVGNEIRTWEEGRCVVFDDSFEHEVWNRSSRFRAVLLIDTWHPDLTAEQRALARRLPRPNGSANEARKGWYRYDRQEATPEAAGDRMPAELQLFRSLGTDTMKSLASTLRESRSSFVRTAATFALEGAEATAGAPQEDLALSGVELWRLLASFFPSPHASTNWTEDRIIELLQICSVYWRSNQQNLLTMMDFLAERPIEWKVTILNKLAGLNDSSRIVDYLSTHDEGPFGALVPLAILALRNAEQLKRP